MSDSIKTDGPAPRAELKPAPEDWSQKAAETKQTLLKAVLDSYREGYKELGDVWRTIETKAQGNIAVSGIFIAGVFAYIQKVDPQLRRAEKGLLALAAAFLIAGVVCSIIALRLRTVSAPPMGGFVDQLMTNLLRHKKGDKDFVERLSSFSFDQIEAWRAVERQLIESNRSKARYLRWGQSFLTVAVLTVGLLTLVKIFGFG